MPSDHFRGKEENLRADPQPVNGSWAHEPENFFMFFRVASQD